MFYRDYTPVFPTKNQEEEVEPFIRSRSAVPSKGLRVCG